MMPKLFSSIFFKLMLVILLAGLGINMAIIFFFGAFRHHIASSYHPHLNQYVDYLLKDIGDPPDPLRAKKIATETNMIISYEGKNQTWTTADAPIAVPVHRFRIRHREKNLEAGSFRGNYMVRVKQGEGWLTFLLTQQSGAEKKIRVIGFALLFFITMLMVGAYIIIRWVLKPLRWLKYGVEQVARGELSHRVPVKRSDELRDLSVSFNTMTERLGHLIQSKEQLLLDVSHELRTPITRMKVALAMMPDSSDRDSIEEDLKEMEKKITQLLETARSINIKASLNYTTVTLSDLIRDTARPFEAGQPAILITPIPAVQIRLDAEKISQAIKNILENSQKYSPEGAQSIQVSVDIEPQTVILAIQDHGIGIGSEDLDFIFEPFYRADKARSPNLEGYGLGLSMAKNLIEAHGGTIDVSSEVGRGTLVRIHLPLTPPSS